ncbi:hypothetical protein C2G38_1185076 [Gigaspora rosea]|uniref:TLDc domain-containing protein n=1 Tax=Gigaspora rosea TaxID=44941 RepID=A0A397VDN9_9GLOM|nr:hypothetical protein C2G38_1185076 [Gigaspora rosea]
MIKKILTSLYFRDKLANTSKDQNNIRVIDLNHVSIQQFEIIIKYIYGGVILLSDQEASFIFELMFVACELLLGELVKHLETILIKNHASWLRLRFTHIYQTSFQNKQLRELQKWSSDIAARHPSVIFDSEDFTSFQENALVSLIKRDDLQMKEVKIWDYIIKWGIAHTPNLPPNRENWTQENFLDLKVILKNFLPLIRYFQISGGDIIDNIQSYQQILDKNLWDDLTIKFMDPNRQISSTILPPRVILTQALPARRLDETRNSINSKIINETHAAEISTWIDKKIKAYSVTNYPYEFKLLLRGTRDGFTANSFWNLCDKQTHLVVVMKVNETDEILGGYNPIGWDQWTTRRDVSDSFHSSVLHSRVKHCEDSFIFSLKNGTIQSSILSRVSDPEIAILCNSAYGPCFSYDLIMCLNEDNRCYGEHTAYKKAIRNRTNWFSVSEYEIFQIQQRQKTM